MLNRLLRYMAFISILVAASSCAKSEDDSLPWLKSDIGPKLHIDGKSARWNARFQIIGESGFTACAGFCRYTDPGDGDGHYSIDVEYVMANSNRVCFQRDIPLIDLPKEFKGDDLSKIVSYDESSRVVTFLIGDLKHTYTLPIPP